MDNFSDPYGERGRDHTADGESMRPRVTGTEREETGGGAVLIIW